MQMTIKPEDILLALKMQKQVERWEGRKTVVYRCSAGKLTVGVGYNLEKPGAGKLIKELGLNYKGMLYKGAKLGGSLKEAEELTDTIYLWSFLGCILNARHLIKNFDALDIDARGILADMIFNMGNGSFSRFRNLRKASARADYRAMAHHMKNSKWYRQTHRAKQYYTDMLAIAERHGQ